MSGDTEDTTATDVNSVVDDSALIWTDNPELEYFRSMITNRMDERKASGLDVDDSLIGDSTIRDMLEVGEDDDSNLFPSRRNGFGIRDTSGLSDTENDAENDTVDNIYVEDETATESILAAMKKTTNRELEDGMLEQEYTRDEELFPARQKNCPPPHRPQRCPLPQSNNNRKNTHGDDIIIKNREPANIPGFIFVTEEHSSVIKTCNSNKQSGKKNKYEYDDNGKRGKENERKATCFVSRTLIICLALVVIIASSTVAVLVSQNKPKSPSSSSFSSSSSQAADDLTTSIPSGSATFTPSSLRKTTIPEPSSTLGTNIPTLPVLFPTVESSTLQPTRDTSSVPSIATPTTTMPASPAKSITFPPTEKASDSPTPAPTGSPSLSSSPVPTSYNSPTKLMTISPTVTSTQRITSTNMPTQFPISTSVLPTSVPSLSFPIDTSSATPTSRPTSLAAAHTHLPTALSPNLPEAPYPIALTDYPTFWTTWYTSDETFSTSEPFLRPPHAIVPAAPPTTCISTIATKKTSYEEGDDIEILFNNCDPTSEDWIGIFPAREDISNLRQPLAWLWVCGNQFCNKPIVSGEATLYKVSGFGDFRVLLLRGDENNDNEFSAYGIGNRFSISSNCSK